MNKTVTIATLVRNREFILPLFLQYLYQLNYPKNLITILWIINNSTDNSKQILYDFKKQYGHEYNKIKIEEMNRSGLPEDSRTANVRNKYTYTHLANLRNMVITKSKSTDYLFSIDSDILLIDCETINKLMSHNKDIVASLIYNGYLYNGGKTPHLYTNAMVLENNIYKHLSRIHIRQILKNEESLLQPIDLTGAICLVSNKVVNNKNIKYGFHLTGEDAYWSECVKKEGYKMYVDLNCYNQHIMSPEFLQKFLNGELNNEIINNIK